MNILPKKRWHVRTKDNIARVRRDEAEAREQEEKRSKKLKFAESEARINFLRRQSGIPVRQSTPTTDQKPTSSNSSEHIHLFEDVNSHVKASNKELEKEKKEEREKYEKQIGYLTYLGQDTNEALKLRSWYEIAPSRSKHATDASCVTENDIKTKFSQDPLTFINAVLPNEKKSRTSNSSVSKSIISNSDGKVCDEYSEQASTSVAKQHSHKKHKKEKKKSKKQRKQNRKHKKDKRYIKEKALEAKQQQKRETIEKLRIDRLKREEVEKTRQELLLKPAETVTKDHEKKTIASSRVVQKYNCQFNPELAKQNIN